MGGFLEPKITKNPKKIDSKRHQEINHFLDRFLIDFSSVLGAKMVPCWPPFSAQDRPRGLPDGSRYSQDALKTALNFPRHPKMLPRRPKTPPRRPKTPPRRLQTSILADFWSIFGRFLIDFWWILVDFWLIFGWFLIDFLSMFHRTCYFVTLLLCYFVTLLLCYFVLGAVAGSQLCCAVDN